MFRRKCESPVLVDCTESSISTSVTNNVKSQYPQNNEFIKTLENELTIKRKKYLNSWAQSISQLHGELRSLILEVKNDYKMELQDAQYYRIRMFQVEGKISKLNEIIRKELCSLIKEEQELNKDLHITERRLEDWGKSLNSNIFKPIVSSTGKNKATKIESHNLNEFQKFLSNSGGHYGGWEEQDHLLFLRERRKYNGKPKFIASVNSIIPELSYNDIEEHENWYKKYELLKNLQKDAIKKWRANKSLIVESDASLQNKNGIEENPVAKNRTTYQRDIAERIKEWKRRQQEKKEEQEEQERKEQQSLAEERIKKKELQKMKKLAVEQYKVEKLNRIQNELMASQKIKELQAIEDKARKNVLLKAFREQDMRYIERIRSLRTQSASKYKDKVEASQNIKPTIEIVVERDPRRLFQPTFVWNRHCAHEENQIDKPTKIMDLQAIPHLAIPSWRKGLNNI